MNYYVLEARKEKLISGNEKPEIIKTYYFAMEKGQKFPVGGPFQTSKEADRHIAIIEKDETKKEWLDKKHLSDIETGENLWIGRVDGKKISGEVNTLDEVFDSAEKAMANEFQAQPEDQEDEKNRAIPEPANKTKSVWKKRGY